MPAGLSARNLPADPEQAPTALSAIAEAEADQNDEPHDAREGADGTRLPTHQRLHKSLKRSPGWVWKLGCHVQAREAEQKALQKLLTATLTATRTNMRDRRMLDQPSTITRRQKNQQSGGDYSGQSSHA